MEAGSCMYNTASPLDMIVHNCFDSLIFLVLWKVVPAMC